MGSCHRIELDTALVDGMEDLGVGGPIADIPVDVGDGGVEHGGASTRTNRVARLEAPRAVAATDAQEVDLRL